MTRGFYPRVRCLFCLFLALVAVGAVSGHEAVAAGACTEVAAEAGWAAPTVTADARTLAMDTLIETLASLRVVYVGESHDRYDHHLNQVEILCRIHARHRDLAIGMEMFQRPFQMHLDDYVAGGIDLDTLLRRTEYFERWRYDARFYAPILEFARAHRIPLIALNLPAELTRRVARQGIEALTPAERDALPAMKPADSAYRERLRAVFELHPDRAHRDFERFVTVQLLWEEGMAESAARYLDVHPGRHLVVFAGNGHLSYGVGIPDRLTRRTGFARAVVLNGSAEGEMPAAGEGDYALASPHLDLPRAGLLGVFMEPAGAETEIGAGLAVSGFSDGSAAAAAGVLVGDLIVTIEGGAVSSFGDIKSRLWHRQIGEQVRLRVSTPGADAPRELEVILR